MRRGGALLPDVQRHLMACRYCRHAAEQLSHFEGGLEDLLVETVLGWGARRYLGSRQGRDEGRSALPGGGRHRFRPRADPATGRSLSPRRHTKALAAAIGVTSLVLLATLLTARGWTEESGTAGPRATWGAVSGHSVAPDGAGSAPGEPDSTAASSERSSSAGAPSAASAGSSAEVARGRLRNLDDGLCLDVRGGLARAEARIVLTACSAGGSQQWSYQEDGVLRSVADPTLCLGSDPAEGSVVLAGCLVHAGVVRYDLTVRGELLPRGGRGLAVAPGQGRDVIVTRRDGSAAQRWTVEPPDATGGQGEPRRKRAEDSPRESREERGREEREQRPYGEAPPGQLPEPPRSGSGEPTQERYETRFAPVDCCEEGGPGTGETGPRPGADVLGPATATVTDAVAALHSAALP
jgi:hypothetical protein